nr:CAP domain-containing protein [uncultured Catonella sp.]
MRKGIKNKIVAVLLASMFISGMSSVRGSVNNITKAEEITATGINVAYHTENEIREFVKNHPADFNSPAAYDEKPLNTPPYSLGKLNNETLQSALNAVNQMRYIAGIKPNVVLNEDYVTLAQGASVINAINNVLTHYPDKPEGMSDELYKICKEGAKRSNVGMGYDNLSSGMVFVYAEDENSSNIEKLGHRRWILNPYMTATGFGYYNKYLSTYAVSNKNETVNEYGIAWPAQNMPVDYFDKDYPWSISMGYEVPTSGVNVELRRLGDNKVWNFSKTKSSDGYFNVNNDRYGQRGCIIFKPFGIEKYINGDKFKVTITGLNRPLSYQVSFFDLVPVTDIEVDGIPNKIEIGEEVNLNFKAVPENAINDLKISTDSDVLKLSNTYTKDGIITVNSIDGSKKECNEVIIAKKYGIAKVTASSLDGKVTKTYMIKVIPSKGDIHNADIVQKGKNDVIEIKVEKNDTVSGYEVLYSTNEKFKKAKKMFSNSPKNTKFVIKKMSLNNTYYIKTRSFVKVGNTRLYGDYSKVQKCLYYENH